MQLPYGQLLLLLLNWQVYQIIFTPNNTITTVVVQDTLALDESHKF